MADHDLEGLVETFADAVAKQSGAIMAGDARRGNRHARRYVEAYRQLALAGDAGRDALAVLLTHIRPDVRGMAAAFLLGYKHAEASKVLASLARGTGLVALEASECLKRWEEGSWELDPTYRPSR